jgi:pyruvate,water dikinase
MAKTFMDPHDVPTIPGTEGWEKFYPYQYIFSREDPERAKFESSQIWFYDGLHYPEPHYPFDLIWDEAWSLALSQYNTRHYIIPLRGSITGSSTAMYISAPWAFRTLKRLGKGAPLHGTGRVLLPELGQAIRELEEEDDRHDRPARSHDVHRSA